MSVELPKVARALLDPAIYPEKTKQVALVQTQMSFVFLAGKYVYKIKKPVNLGYLDYTTLEKRKFFCEQEVKLNRRLCPAVYLGVVPVTHKESGFTLGGAGKPAEYAVKMLYLPQDRNLNILLEKNEVTSEMMKDVANRLAAFHAAAETSPAISDFGKTDAIRVNTDENFSQTEKYFGITITKRQFKNIQSFTNNALEQKSPLFNQRATSGRIRDCHGDLYSQHVCFSDGICIYDCIEFNDRFRYCDVASEIAFLAMDLDHYGRADLSRVFIKTYVDSSGDSQIEDLLKFYKCYRAYVRGKVGSFKYDDPYISPDERQKTRAEARVYFQLADSYSREKPFLFITVGLVGSGKTTLARALAKRLGLTVISSDIVRKNLASVPITEHRFDEMESGIYSPESTRRTYDRLFSEAESILKRGEPVILDASFVSLDERIKAQEIANKAGADFCIVETVLDEDNTRKRLEQRLKEGDPSDGRWAIYGPQKKKFAQVTEVGPERHFIIDSAKSLDDQISRIIDRV